MSPPRRWPLHPRPAPGEALSSWLTRLAGVYGLSLQELLQHNLGPACFEMGHRNIDELDLAPPAAVLTALHERTGVPRDRLRQMTIAGWVPWLLDTLDTSDDPAVFDTYVRQDSVLLGPGEAQRREVYQWRPWLPAQPMRRACPRCASYPERGFTLMSQLPIMISCPEHGCRLESAASILLAALTNENVSPQPVNAHVVALDRRTHEGLTTGMVTLAARPVHIGVWFRLLRTLLDELNTPTSMVGTSSRISLQRIWKFTDCPPRAGQSRWWPYEALSWPTQQAMLHAAAATLHLIKTGAVTARGTLGPLLRDGPHPLVPDGDPPGPPRSPSTQTQWDVLVGQVLDDARAHPEHAADLLRTLTAFSRHGDSYDRVRDTLIQAQVPEEWLPTYQATESAGPAHVRH